MNAAANKNKNRGPETRFWRFTCNNYTPQCIDAFQKVDDRIEYLCYAEEVGAQGTPHLQGYLVFKKKKYLSGCQKISKRTDFGPANGTPSQNYRYCRKGQQSKEEYDSLKEQGPNYGLNLKGWFEYGVLPPDPKEIARKGSASGGKATSEKWEEIWVAAKEARFGDIPAKIRVNSWRTINAIAQDHQKMPTHLNDVCGIWLQGPPNTGKSHFARHYMGSNKADKLAPETANYEKLLNKWWDGYNDQKTPYVFIEEIDHTHAPFMGAYLKRWADKWSFSAEHKGTTRCHRPQAVIVTSNYSIAEVFFQQGAMMIQAVQRRFKIIRFYGETEDELTGARNENPEQRNHTWVCRFIPETQEEIVDIDEIVNSVAQTDVVQEVESSVEDAYEIFYSDAIEVINSVADSHEGDESAASVDCANSEEISSEESSNTEDRDFIRENDSDVEVIDGIPFIRPVPQEVLAAQREQNNNRLDLEVMLEIRNLLGDAFSSADV